MQEDDEWIARSRTLAAVVTAGDADAAHLAAQALLTPSTTMLMQAIQRLEESS